MFVACCSDNAYIIVPASHDAVAIGMVLSYHAKPSWPHAIAATSRQLLTAELCLPRLGSLQWCTNTAEALLG